MASSMLHDEMLPQTQAIDQLNVKQLESEYASFKSTSVIHIGVIAASGLALLVVLGYMQLFISKKMRRSFNLPLLAASAVVVALTAYSIVGMTLQRSNLGAAKETSFVSAYNWLEARGAAYDAKTDQSLFLIALGAGAKYEESAKVKVEKLAAAAAQNAQGDSASALSALRAYVQQDERIRSYDKGGKRAEAVNLALGNGTQEAQKSFDDLNQVLTANLKTATSSFEASIASAESNINLLDLAFIVLSLAVVALAYFGLTPRINEYRA
ncbi:MAG: hypothetical protein BWY87_01418 [Deltaproteobacteria bacterium ADurb.Bin510]|nr:MAG: hypothetical protein BWY87_01418 [Deltaproteobacteria bacterium ADurb.Bin510]